MSMLCVTGTSTKQQHNYIIFKFMQIMIHNIKSSFSVAASASE